MELLNIFKNQKQIEGIISLIPNEEILEAFVSMNLERLRPLFGFNAKVLRYEEGNFCSNCGYKFRGEQSNYHYCISCLEELACCDDPFCDRDNQRIEENIWNSLESYYRQKHR